MAQATDLDVLRWHSLWLSRLTLFLLIVTALLIVVPTMRGLVLLSGREAPLAPVVWHALVLWSPSVCYLYALWAIRSAFRDFACGGHFGPAVAAGCTRAGIALALGGTLSAVGVPNLARVLSRHGLLDDRFQIFKGVLVFDIAYLAVGVVGLALVLLGRLLRRASELQAEAASLRNELDEFF